MTMYFTTDTVADAVGTSQRDADDFSLDTATIERIDNPPWEIAFDTDRFYKFETIIARPIEQRYVEDGDVYTFKKPTEELERAAWSFDNRPYTISHPDTKIVTPKTDIHGFYRNPQFVRDYDENGDALTTDLYIPTEDERATEFIRDNQAVSVGIFNDLDWTADEDGVDAYQTDIFANHVAGVERGRCSVEDGCGITTDTSMRTIANDALRVTHDDHFNVGDTVRWSWSGGTAHGRIDTVVTEAGQTTAAEGETREATEDRPAYKIEVYRDGDGEYSGFAVKLHGENDLSSWAGPTADSCSGSTCTCGCHTETTDDEIDNTVTDEDTTMSDNDPNTDIDFESIVGGMAVDAVAEKNDNVAAIVEDKKEAEDRIDVLEEKVEDLQSSLDESQSKVEAFENGEREPKSAVVDSITDLTAAWDNDELMDLDRDELDRRLKVAEDAASSPSTPDDEGETETNDGTNVTNDGADDGPTVSNEHRSWADD